MNCCIVNPSAVAPICDELEHLNRTSKRRTVVFLISDFQDSSFEATLKVARRKHDIIPVVISDPREGEMPNVGLVLQDEETGEVITLDTASRQNREIFARLYKQQSQARDVMFVVNDWNHFIWKPVEILLILCDDIFTNARGDREYFFSEKSERYS